MLYSLIKQLSALDVMYQLSFNFYLTLFYGIILRNQEGHTAPRRHNATAEQSQTPTQEDARAAEHTPEPGTDTQTVAQEEPNEKQSDTQVQPSPKRTKPLKIDAGAIDRMIQNLEEKALQALFQVLQRSLFIDHRRIFGFLYAVSLDLSHGALEESHWNYFVQGASALESPQQRGLKWAPSDRNFNLSIQKIERQESALSIQETEVQPKRDAEQALLPERQGQQSCEGMQSPIIQPSVQRIASQTEHQGEIRLSESKLSLGSSRKPASKSQWQQLS